MILPRTLLATLALLCAVARPPSWAEEPLEDDAPIAVTVQRPRVLPIAVSIEPFTGRDARAVEEAFRRAAEATGFFDVVSPERARWRVACAVERTEPAVARLRIDERDGGREVLQVSLRGTPEVLGPALADALLRQHRRWPVVFGARLAALRPGAAGTEIVLTAWDGTRPRVAYRENGPLALHGWSPDGRVLLFTTWRTGKPEVWALEPARGAARPFLAVGELSTAAAFSPAGDRVAFVAAERGQIDLYVADGDGSRVRRITRDEAVEASPTWSGDGRRLAFVSSRSGRARIWIVDPASASRPQPLDSGLVEEHAPRFAPRGGLLAFTGRAADGRWASFTVTPGRGDLVQITGGGAEPEESTWAASGELLVVRSGAGLAAVTSDGARQTPLPAGGLRSPAWSRGS